MFKYFFASKETIPEGMGFDLFGPLHLTWLAVTCIFYIIICIWHSKQSPETQLKSRRVVALAMLIIEVIKMTVLFVTGTYLHSYIPLQLCSFSIYFSVWHAFRPGKLNSELLYALSFIGALMALLFSNWAMLPFWNFHHIQSFITHILIVLYPLLLLSEGYKPNYKMLPKCLLVVVLLAIPLYFLNKLLNTNFMFLNWADVGNPLSLFEAMWGRPWYILSVFPMLAAAWLLMYLPWEIAKKVKQKKELSA